MSKFKKLMPLMVILFISLIALHFDLHKFLSFETLKTHNEELQILISQKFYICVLAYSIAYILVAALSIPAATFMTVTSGFLFGQMVGTTIVVLSATIGATFLFLSARYASSNLLDNKENFVTKMQKGFQESALSYLLTLRLVPLFPFVIVNLAAAFFQIPAKTFIIGTLIGIIPGSFVYSSIGVALQTVVGTEKLSPNLILDPQILLAFIGLGILSLLPILYKKLKAKSPKIQY